MTYQKKKKEFLGTIMMLSFCDIWICLKSNEIKRYRNSVLSAKRDVSQRWYENLRNSLSRHECVYRLNSGFKWIPRTWYKYSKVQKPVWPYSVRGFKTSTKNTFRVLRPRPLPRFHERRYEYEILFCFNFEPASGIFGLYEDLW